MNALNAVFTKLFDLFLAPLELLGDGWAIVLASGIIGIVGLIGFKYVSFQKHIKAAKDKVKGHLIEIRIYQDDLFVVAKAFCQVMLRNLQYLAYNFVSMIPLLVVFVFILVQFVVRFAFAPLPVEELRADFMPGQGTMLSVEFAAGHEARADDLTIEYPEAVIPQTRLARSASAGRAWQEVVVVEPGVHEIAFVLADGSRTTKTLVAGEDAPRLMQPERGRGLVGALLWPVEEAFGADSPFARVSFAYPDRDLGWLPGGVVGVLIVFLVASMAFGALVLKPLKIQI